MQIKYPFQATTWCGTSKNIKWNYDLFSLQSECLDHFFLNAWITNLLNTCCLAKQKGITEILTICQLYSFVMGKWHALNKFAHQAINTMSQNKLDPYYTSYNDKKHEIFLLRSPLFSSFGCCNKMWCSTSSISHLSQKYLLSDQKLLSLLAEFTCFVGELYTLWALFSPIWKFCHLLHTISF